MDEKPQRRRFRFRLISLFALIAAIGGLACLWNPFERRPGRANLSLIEPGMTIAEVAALVGEPDESTPNVAGTRIVQKYQLNKRESWWVYYVDGEVRESNHNSRLQPDW